MLISRKMLLRVKLLKLIISKEKLIEKGKWIISMPISWEKPE
jgi:hypothetical protein